MNLRLLSYLASLGFRADLDQSDASRETPQHAETRAESEAADCDDQTSLQFVRAL